MEHFRLLEITCDSMTDHFECEQDDRSWSVGLISPVDHRHSIRHVSQIKLWTLDASDYRQKKLPRAALQRHEQQFRLTFSAVF